MIEKLSQPFFSGPEVVLLGMISDMDLVHHLEFQEYFHPHLSWVEFLSAISVKH